MMDAASAYGGKRVLVTGADGFIGSHLAEALVGAGARVSVLLRATSTSAGCPRPFRRIARGPECFERIAFGDIAAPETVEAIRSCAPEIVFHLAAAAWVNYSFDHPDEVFRTNAVGTLRVLEACRALPALHRVVIVSSSEVYGTRQAAAIDEDHPLMPTSPYAASKAAADRLAHAWHVTWSLPATIVRPFNTYGPRHTYDVIPKFIELALRGAPLTIHGDGKQERDFSYVDDTVRGLLLAGRAEGAAGEVVNLGTGTAHSIRHVAERIVALAGSDSPIVHGAPRPAEVRSLLCNCSKAWRLLGHRAGVTLDEGLSRNIAWARSATPGGVATT